MSTTTLQNEVGPAAGDEPSPPAARPPSDWPASLLLDELWLRTRRVLVRRLEAERLWPTSEEIRSHRARRTRLGEHLRTDLVARMLAPEDHRRLESDAVFGPGTDQLHTKIGRCLSFGYELGTAFHRVAVGTGVDLERPASPAEARAAQLCAIFNLGIGIFDLVQDESPELAGAFAQFFDEKALRDALADAASAGELSVASAALAVPELRLLGRLIAAFLTGLHTAIGDAVALEPIGELLMAAYAAETASIAGDGGCPLQVSRAKSTLPFRVLLETVGLVGDEGTGAAVPALVPAAEAIGTTFWLVDDLVDLVVDFQAGALNSILARAGGTAPDGEDVAAAEYALLANVLGGSYIEDTVEEVVRSVRATADGFLRHGRDPGTAGAAAAIVRDYVRFWAE